MAAYHPQMAVSVPDPSREPGPRHANRGDTETGEARGVTARRASRLHWRSLSDGLLVALLVCGPALLATEGLRHRVGRTWLIPAVIGIIGMGVAGAVAGRHRRRPTGALLQGLAVGLPVSILLVLADVLYRLISNNPLSGRTAAAWVGAVAGAVVVACLGALVGRAVYLRRWRQRGKL